MSRNINATMEAIINVLKSHVSEDDSYLITPIKRHIIPEGDKEQVKDFVKLAKIKSISCYLESLFVLEFKEQRYILIPEKYIDAVLEIGLNTESDIAIIQGAGMLAMSSGKLPLEKNVDSAIIIERCLGIIPENPDDTDIEVDFSEIVKLFIPYCIIQVDDSRFPLVFMEDFNRLAGYLLTDTYSTLEQSSKGSLKQLLLLQSSRSIAGSLLNGIQNPMIEYTYLQIYQCIEYLFRLNNCFTISETHGVALGTSMDIVLAHEFRSSESDNLLQILRKYADEALIEVIVDLTSVPLTEIKDIYQKAASYIYMLRCNVAHLRYKQDDTSSVSWIRCVTALIDIVLSIYQKCDAKIISVCTAQNAWLQFTMDN